MKETNWKKVKNVIGWMFDFLFVTCLLLGYMYGVVSIQNPGIPEGLFTILVSVASTLFIIFGYAVFLPALRTHARLYEKYIEREHYEKMMKMIKESRMGILHMARGLTVMYNDERTRKLIDELIEVIKEPEEE